MHSSKHLVNRREDSVLESINGFVQANNQNLFTLKDYPNVVLRRDYLDLVKSKKVALLSGGGSGHEPAHTGFIGKGMLTAVVCGNVFASPSTASIFAGIRAVGAGNEAGVLMIVKNYTGDRLNFGIAAKRAQSEGIRVEYVLVDDDVALLNDYKLEEGNVVGCRGLAGTLFIHKLAGALAEQNKSLDEIKRVVDSVLKEHCIRTVGVSLSGGVDLPTQAVIVKNTDDLQNALGFDQIEIGLGIHGEAGKTRVKIEKCFDLVKSVLRSLELSDHESNLDVCLLVNNLGSLSNFEFSLLINDCCKYFVNERRNYRVRRLYSGALMTALNMNGFSITMFIVKDKSLLELLDFETNAFSWPRLCGVDVNSNETSSRAKSASISRPASAKVQIDESRYVSFNNSEHRMQLLRTCLGYICRDLIDMKDYLNDLDTVCGDGDTGNSVENMSEIISSKLDDPQVFNLNAPHQAFMSISYLIEQCGGTMAAILALGTSAAANGFTIDARIEDNALFWLKYWYAALDCGLNAIQEFGGAKPNQRSLADPLFSVRDHLKAKIAYFDANKDAAVDVNAIVKELVNVSYESAHATAKMVPKVGRASYVDPKLITKPDAGAFAISSIFSSIYKGFLKLNTE